MKVAWLRRVQWRFVAIPGLVVLGAMGVGCGGEAAVRELTVSLREWEVTPGVEELAAGKVALSVKNEGRQDHELIVVKSDLPPGELAVVGGKVDESRLKVVGRVAPLAAGSTGTLELKLSGGKYLLLCNLVEGGESHYAAGMHAGLFVAP